MLFAFGFSLNNHNYKLKTYNLRHIIIVVVLILLFFYDIGLLYFKVFDIIERYLVADRFVIKLFYVYLGWLFSEK